MKKDIKYYFSEDMGENVIELHDNHTLWKVNSDNFIEKEYYFLIEEVCEMFKNKFDTELLLCGRSGRHVCVKDNDFNRRHYKSMKNYALKLEKHLVEYFNTKKFEKKNIKKLQVKYFNAENIQIVFNLHTTKDNKIPPFYFIQEFDFGTYKNSDIINMVNEEINNFLKFNKMKNIIYKIKVWKGDWDGKYIYESEVK